MRFENFTFGSIEVDGKPYDHDLVIDRGRIQRRDKSPSKRRRSEFGHTPLTAAEEIPWNCRRLVIGTGASGSLPVSDDMFVEARQRGVELVVKPTREALVLLEEEGNDTNAVLHLTC